MDATITDNKKINATIGNAINWFKTMSTNEYIRGVKNNNWQPFDKKSWVSQCRSQDDTYFFIPFQ